MPDRPRHPNPFAAIRNAIATDPRCQLAMNALDQLLPQTAAQLRNLSDRLPDVADAVIDQARDQVVGEAQTLDRAVNRAIAGAIDELLVAARARTPPAKRLTRGSQSRARQAARKGGR